MRREWGGLAYVLSGVDGFFTRFFRPLAMPPFPMGATRSTGRLVDMRRSDPLNSLKIIFEVVIIKRTNEGKIVGGVCSGFQKYNDIPAAITRVAFVLGLFLSGLSGILYILLWLFTPDENGQSALGGKPSSIESSTKVEEELKRIASLKDQGLISDQDHQQLREKTMAVHVDGTSADPVQAELARIQKMHEDGFIDKDELQKMRRKALGI